MPTAPTDAIALYPMVEEGEASGTVACCYAAMLQSMPFVPSLFKSLAVCPPYLVLAWDQASHAIVDDDFTAAAAGLANAARGTVPEAPDADVRAALTEFVAPLGRMLLLASGLLAALGGQVTGRPASSDPPPEGPVQPARPVPHPWQVESDGLFGEIRYALGTPIINSIWRSLAGRALLRPAWDHLAPHVPDARAAAGDLQREAASAAHGLHWPVVAGPDALAGSGIEDAAPGMAAVLDGYLRTLPRVLVLVAANTET